MQIRALFVDAANTLLTPREPVGVTYARAARARGYPVDPSEVEQRFRAAMRTASPIPGDRSGRRFWRPIVAEAVGVDDPALFDELYQRYAEPSAWWVDVEALQLLGRVARTGVRLGIISNFDRRLRTLYGRLALDRMFSVLVISSEVDAEKPDPAIFHIACECAGVKPSEAVHVGDDPVRDVEGARSAGLVGVQFDDELGWAAVSHQLDALRRPFVR